MIIIAFTLFETLMIIAVLIVLGMLVYLAFKIKIAVGNASPSGGGTGAAATQFSWVKKPSSFPKNIETSFEVVLERYNSAAGRWAPYSNEDALVGAVNPDTVGIEAINGSAPGTPEAVSELPAGVTVYRVKTASDGSLTFVLKGTQPEETAELFIYYVSSSGSVTSTKAAFTVTD